MNEKQWRTAKCVNDLLRHETRQFRKWRLVGCACARRALVFVHDERLHSGVEAAERFADRELTRIEIKRFRNDVLTARLDLKADHEARREQHETAQAVFRVLKEKPVEAFVAHEPACYAFSANNPDWRSGFEAEERKQIAIAYDIFGNPFRPPAFSPSWRTGDAVALARQMYDSRDFGAMPILADALQDAGCDSEDILSHCRDADAPHTRGCWVVDLVLGKE